MACPYINITNADFNDPMAHILLHCGLTKLLPTTNQAKSRIECQYKSSIGKQNQEFTNGDNYPSIKNFKMVQNNKDMQSFSSKFCKSCHKIQPSGEGILHYTNKKFMNNVYIPFISYDIGISKN